MEAQHEDRLIHRGFGGGERPDSPRPTAAATYKNNFTASRLISADTKPTSRYFQRLPDTPTLGASRRGWAASPPYCQNPRSHTHSVTAHLGRDAKPLKFLGPVPQIPRPPECSHGTSQLHSADSLAGAQQIRGRVAQKPTKLAQRKR